MKYQNRVERAKELFMQGFNCAQSVVAAYVDLFGFTEEQALKMSASFGAGIGRMRQTCGAACGMFMLAGLQCGTIDPNDREGKKHNYEVVQSLAAEFKRINHSLICAELLGLSSKTTLSSTPEERTAEYYAKRPCVKMVESAAWIFGEYLERIEK